jgi:hypothetical protein
MQKYKDLQTYSIIPPLSLFRSSGDINAYETGSAAARKSAAFEDLYLFVELITTLRVPQSDLNINRMQGLGSLDRPDRRDERDRPRDGDRDGGRDGGRSPLKSSMREKSRMSMDISSLSGTGTHRARSNSVTERKSIDVNKSASFFDRFKRADSSLNKSTNGFPGRKDNNASDLDDGGDETPPRGRDRRSLKRGMSADDTLRRSTDSRLSRERGESPTLGRQNRSREIRDFERDFEDEYEEDEAPVVVEMCSGWVMIPIAGENREGRGEGSRLFSVPCIYCLVECSIAQLHLNASSILTLTVTLIRMSHSYSPRLSAQVEGAYVWWHALCSSAYSRRGCASPCRCMEFDEEVCGEGRDLLCVIAY